MRKLFCYVHTHWDREWYRPFESFRMQLVPVVRNILQKLETNDLPPFYLDGQSVIFEDVLEIDPTLSQKLRAAMDGGKLTAGPWYVLADQMLVSGESLVRNLHYGIAGTSSFGMPASVGYCPDTFGHSQDLPRILSGFGIKNAVIWRGAPALTKGPVFRWISPDGSHVIGYHFTRGYYQTAFHEALSGTNAGAAGTKVLAESLLTWVDAQVQLDSREQSLASPFAQALNGSLMPIGADHVGPPAGLTKLIANLNRLFQSNKQNLELIPISLPSFLAHVVDVVEADGSLEQEVRGELRSNAAAAQYERAYLLYGVLSTRLYLKRANRLAEFALARSIEPLYAILRSFSLAQYPYGELDYAWKLLMKNHAHDSICGCSVDEVHRQMMARSAKLCDALDSLFDAAWSATVASAESAGLSHRDPAMLPDCLSIFNTSGETISAPARLRFALEVGAKLPKSSNLQIISKSKQDHLFSGWGAVPYYKEVELVEAWVWSELIPPLAIGNFAWPFNSTAMPGQPAEVVTKGERLTNGILDVAISAKGKITVSHLVPGGKIYKLGHDLKDVADVGDTYNFDWLRADKPVFAKVIAVQRKDKGPLVGSVEIIYEMEIPVSAVAADSLFTPPGTEKIESLKRNSKRLKHRFQTTVSLKRGLPILFFETEWENLSADHRLEVLFDTGNAVKTTVSENHFSVVERVHKPEREQKLPVPLVHEALPDRFPCQRFFIANGQVFFNTGLPEYGVNESQVSLTLLRAVSWLSKPRLNTRGGGAGPNMPVPEANCFGKNLCTYGWAPLAVATKKNEEALPLQITQAYKLSEAYENPLVAFLGRKQSLQSSVSDEPPSAGRSLFKMDNSNIRMVSCFCARGKRGEEQLLIRLLNVSHESQQCQALLPRCFASAELQQLDGTVVRKLALVKDGEGARLNLQFGTNELVTVGLRLPVTNVSPDKAEKLAAGDPQKTKSATAKKPSSRASLAKRKQS